MKNKSTKPALRDAGFKGEIVDEKTESDLEAKRRNLQANPYKTPPNNLTTKSK